jgi:hypothetical protein
LNALTCPQLMFALFLSCCPRIRLKSPSTTTGREQRPTFPSRSTRN